MVCWRTDKREGGILKESIYPSLFSDIPLITVSSRTGTFIPVPPPHCSQIPVLIQSKVEARVSDETLRAVGDVVVSVVFKNINLFFNTPSLPPSTKTDMVGMIRYDKYR